MPSESEVRGAVEYYKLHELSGILDALVSLAEAWLGRKMVEKVERQKHFTGRLLKLSRVEESWNEAIDACRLASVVSDEEIGKIIWGSDLLQHKGGASFVDVDKLSHAIATAINGGKS